MNASTRAEGLTILMQLLVEMVLLLRLLHTGVMRANGALKCVAQRAGGKVLLNASSAFMVIPDADAGTSNAPQM